MEFAKNLKRIRNEKKISQDELAKKLNVSQKTISSWETGRSEPSMGDIEKIATFLDCSQEDLIGLRRDKSTITFQDILLKINDLKHTELETLSQMIRVRLDMVNEMEKLEAIRQEQEKRIQMYSSLMNKYINTTLESKKDEN